MGGSNRIYGSLEKIYLLCMSPSSQNNVCVCVRVCAFDCLFDRHCGLETEAADSVRCPLVDRGCLNAVTRT